MTAPVAGGAPARGPVRGALVSAEREIRRQFDRRRMLYPTAGLAILVLGSVVLSAALGADDASQDPLAKALGRAAAETMGLGARAGPGVPGGARSLAALWFGGSFYLVGITFLRAIASSTLQDCRSRASRAHPGPAESRAEFAEFAGRILGTTVLAVLQIVAIGVLVSAGLLLTGQGSVLALLVEPASWFLLLFAATFVMVSARVSAQYARVFHTAGASAGRSRLGLLVAIPFLGVLVLHWSDTVLMVVSHVPFSAAVAMPLRVFLGTCAGWEPVVSSLVLVVTATVLTAVSARTYVRATAPARPG